MNRQAKVSCTFRGLRVPFFLRDTLPPRLGARMRLTFTFEDMALLMGNPIIVSLLSWMFTFYTVLQRNKKLPNLEISEWSVLGVLMGKIRTAGAHAIG